MIEESIYLQFQDQFIVVIRGGYVITVSVIQILEQYKTKFKCTYTRLVQKSKKGCVEFTL